MTQEQQDRAFDDYYTTRESGMGVGLSFVRKVAAVHGIGLTMRSRPGQGTSVEVAFP
jgi:signal transduction histidine kinase